MLCAGHTWRAWSIDPVRLPSIELAVLVAGGSSWLFVEEAGLAHMGCGVALFPDSRTEPDTWALSTGNQVLCENGFTRDLCYHAKNKIGGRFILF